MLISSWIRGKAKALPLVSRQNINLLEIIINTLVLRLQDNHYNLYLIHNEILQAVG
jgi:hypothetical protein